MGGSKKTARTHRRFQSLPLPKVPPAAHFLFGWFSGGVDLFFGGYQSQKLNIISCFPSTFD